MKPLRFDEALDYFGNKKGKPVDWSSADWQAQKSAVRQKAFFISRVESARFLNRAHGLIDDFINRRADKVLDPQGNPTTRLRVATRDEFVMRMRQFMIKEGMAQKSDFSRVNQKDVRDIRSRSRLSLIFDTNVRQAHGYGQWKQGMTPAALEAFPAARLIREKGVREPRPRHQENLGEVLLKTDPRWAEFHNGKDIGGFGVPWGPYGFNSGCNQEDVSRREAKRLGLKVDQVVPIKSSPNDGLTASLRNMPSDIKRKLMKELKGRPKPRGAKAAARQAAENTRRIMLNRGLDAAKEAGDSRRAARYRMALEGLDGQRSEDLPEVIEREDEVAVITPAIPEGERAGTDIAPKLPDDPSRTGANARRVKQRALELIEQVHGDGPLTSIPFRQVMGGTANAAYNPYSGQRHIELRKIRGGEASVVHEVGHWLDHEAFALGGEFKGLRSTSSTRNMYGQISRTFGSYGDEFKPLMDAAKNTKSFKRIDELRFVDRKAHEYLTSNHEVFARAYAQWVARKTQDAGMIGTIDRSRAQHYGQWEWDEFEPIAKEMDELFNKRGWLRKK